MLKTPGVAVAVAVVALLAGPALAQAPADPAASLFAPGRILRIEIEMALADWREVRISHRDGSDPQMANIAKDGAYAYRPATITIDGVKVARVGIRKKGLLGSVVSTRPSLKVEFDEFVEGQTFQGLDGLTLNNNNQDQAFVQSYLAYDLFRRAGVPAPRANFAHVRVNGEDLGVYTHIEAIDRPFLQRAFGSSNGVLYESYAGDFTGEGAVRIVEKRGGRTQDRSRIGALRDVLTAPGPISIAKVEELVDFDTFMRMWAVESLMGHWDSYSGNRNNFYLYNNPATRKLHFIPWGADALFEDPGPLHIVPVPKSFKAMGVLCQRLWELPEIRDRYRTVMRELLAGPWTESRLVADMAAMQKTLRPLSALLPATIDTATARVATFVTARRAQVEAELTAPGPSWPAGAAIPTNLAPIVLTGSFTAPWGLDAPANPFSRGSGQLSVELAGKAVAIEQVGAFASTHKQGDPSPLALLREKYPTMTLTARAGTQIWVVGLTIDPYMLEPGRRVLPIDHFAVWSIVVAIDGAAPPRLGIFGNVGELRLDEAAVKEGGVLKGTFSIRGVLP
jgi:spore coat protein H